MNQPSERRKVGLFVTCLVDLFRPGVGFAAVRLLEAAGCEVHVPVNQTCCGQPAYNSGDTRTTRAIAEQVIEAFADMPYVVAPSGSCAGMLKKHYPLLFEDSPEWKARAEEFGGRVSELVSFLTDVCNVSGVKAGFDGAVAYHDSCSGLRELGIREQPRKLLNSVDGLEIRELSDREACCGFGGTFCVKYPEISGAIVDRKADDILATGADTLLAGDLGCLLNMAGKLQRKGGTVRVRHVAEVLAGMTDTPAIGEPEAR